MLNNTTFIEKNNNIFSRYVEDYFLLFDSINSILFSFNKATADIWELICQGVTFKNILKYLDVKSDEDMQVLLDFLTVLYENKFITLNSEECNGNINKIQKNQMANYEEYCLKNNIIYSALIELTNKCNLSCKHCYHDEHINSMKIDELCELLDDLKRMGTIVITYTGGEIFLVKDIIKILKFTSDKGFIVNFISNGTLIDNGTINDLMRIPFNTIKTSLYGASAKMHDKITGVEGSFEATMNTIKNLSRFGKRFEVNYIIMNENVDEVEEARDLIVSIGGNFQTDYKIFPSRSGCEQALKLYASKEQFLNLFKKKLITPVSELKCLSGKNRVRINQNGDVFPCEYMNMSFGNIKTKSIIDIWNGAEINEYRNKVENYMPVKCNKCSYKNRCLRCPALVWNNKLYSNNNHEIMCYQAEISCEFGDDIHDI